MGLLVALLVGALALVAGGGWYFASVIHSDALVVRPPGDPERELVLTPEDEGKVRLRGPAEDLEILAEGSRYGLSWDGGYAHVVGPAEVDGGEVLRDLAMLQGRLPDRVRAADLQRDAFPEDPTLTLGKRVTEVEIGPDGAGYPAWLAPRRKSTWAILVHGKGGSRSEMLRMMRVTARAKLPSLAISYRNDAGVVRDGSGHYRYGATEWEDLDAAVRYAEENGAERVVLVGSSMGGAIVASYLREVPDNPVAGVVLDSPMLDLGETVSFGATQRAFPVWGHVPEPVTWAAKRLTTLRYGVEWDRLDYLADSDWLDVPTLVFHGAADTTVPLALSEELARARPDLVELVVSPEADHVESWNLDPRAYDATLRGFLEGL